MYILWPLRTKWSEHLQVTDCIVPALAEWSGVSTLNCEGYLVWLQNRSASGLLHWTALYVDQAINRPPDQALLNGVET